MSRWEVRRARLARLAPWAIRGWLLTVAALAVASLTVLTIPRASAWFYGRADAWLDERRLAEVARERLDQAKALERQRSDPVAAAAVSSHTATRLGRRGGFWTPLEAQALERQAQAHAAANQPEQEVAVRRALLRLQPGRHAPRARLGAALLRAGQPEEGRRLLTEALARDPNCLPALVPLVRSALAQGEQARARRLVRDYERAPLLPQSLIRASRKGGIRLLAGNGGLLASWRCAPPIDGAPHRLRLPLAGMPTTGEARIMTLTISVGPSCEALELARLRFLGPPDRAGVAPELLVLTGSSWPRMEIIGGNRHGADRILTTRDRVRVGFPLPKAVSLQDLDVVELELTLEKRFPPPLDTLRSQRP